MLRWFYNEFTKISTTMIWLTQLVVHYEDIADRFTSVFGLKKLFERRHSMEKYLKLIPLLTQLAKDLEAAAQSPQDQAVINDIKALIADIGSGAPTPPAAA